MYKIIGNKANIFRYKISWKDKNNINQETVARDEQERDLIINKLKNDTETTLLNPPNIQEMIIFEYLDGKKRDIRPQVYYNFTKEDKNLNDIKFLKHNQWDTIYFNIYDYNFNNENFEPLVLFLNGGNGILYLKNLTIYQTDNPENKIIQRKFSEDIDRDHFHLRAGCDRVEEGVFFNEDEVIRIPSGERAFIELKQDFNYAIPKGTNNITVQIEYFIDNPEVKELQITESVNSEIVFEKLDTENYDWIDGLNFNSIEELETAIEVGKDKYKPPLTDTQKLEEETTAIQLALVELYERKGLVN